MHSRMREKYSISTWFYLFCFLLFLTSMANGQEVRWSKSGIGPNPSLTFLGDGTKTPLLLVSSPFANKIQSFGFLQGEKSWSRTFAERVPFATLPLNEAAIVQGDQGTIWALNNESGEILWEVRSDEPLDYPIAPPRFRDSALFTLSRLGRIRKINQAGTVVARSRIPNEWGRRSAHTVPLRSPRQELSFLDQSGRISTLDPQQMSLNVLKLWDNDGEEAARAYGRTREVLAGALTSGAEAAWTLELPGLLQTVFLDKTRTSWRKRLLSPQDFWSSEGQLLSIPTPFSRDQNTALLLTTRGQMGLYEGDTGRIILELPLPSEAKAPPAYDRRTKTWWILCQDHLVSLDSSATPREQKLPFVDTPFSLTVLDNFAVIGSEKGHLYGISLLKAPE